MLGAGSEQGRGLPQRGGAQTVRVKLRRKGAESKVGGATLEAGTEGGAAVQRVERGG